jgi:UV damage endonuclease UvdE
MRRLGFACKWIDNADQVNGIKPTDDCKKYNTGTTTRTWLNKQVRSVAEDKLWTLMKGNIEATRLLVKRVGELDEDLRMVRLSSDLLPVYTEPSWSYFYQQPDVVRYLERHFAVIGDSARENGVRLSFHPGQFCVLASDNENIVENSLKEFEYHADMARYMGFGKSFQDFKINVHLAGKQGAEGFRRAYARLSPESRSCITIENEEITYGLDDCLQLSDVVPIVLDIHHHWCKTGEYISLDDERIDRVIHSWRGVRPVIHYSVSREDVLVNHDKHTMPNFQLLTESGHKKQDLRAHSDFFWNSAVNRWALSHWVWGDMMCESKAKNLASFKLYEEHKKNSMILVEDCYV